MSGSGYEKRRRADAIRAAKMAQHGSTHRQIADAINVDVKQVKSRIELGERLMSLEEPTRGQP